MELQTMKDYRKIIIEIKFKNQNPAGINEHDIVSRHNIFNKHPQ